MSNSSLAVNDVLGVHTNGGHYAKLLVTAKGGGVLTLRYTSYGATAGGAGAPSITQVQNNYSYILPGLPNYGIAPGSPAALPRRCGPGKNESELHPKRWQREKTDAVLQSLWVLENTRDIGALLATLTV